MYKSGKNHPQISCSFCGKPAEQVAKLISGSGVHICNECVSMCYNLMVEELAKDAARTKAAEPVKQLPTPTAIKAHLDEFVIGQDDGLADTFQQREISRSQERACQRIPRTH